MNVLLIGVEDEENFVELLKNELRNDITLIRIDELEVANKVIIENEIDFFVCDTKFDEADIKKMICDIGTFESTKIRGALVGGHMSNELIIFAVNTMMINGILFRAYKKEDVKEMCRRYYRGLERAGHILPSTSV